MQLSLIALTIALSAATPASADPADLKEFGLICSLHVTAWRHPTGWSAPVTTGASFSLRDEV